MWGPFSPTALLRSKPFLRSCWRIKPLCHVDKEYRIGGGKTEIRRVATVNEAVCQGCGACTVTCPSGAMDLKGFATKQIMAEVDAVCKR